MERNKCWGTLRAALLIVVAALAWASGARASTYEVIHLFTWAQSPIGNLTFDAAGNLYGTTSRGGASGSGCIDGCGVVWKLKPNSNGTWTESILHAFKGTDGDGPAAGLVFDRDGNLYGTTAAGGAYDEGVVFKLKPNPDGTWTESVLYSFTGGADGAGPIAGLIFDAACNLYGTTRVGGADGDGMVFKLALNPDGSWTESVLHSFTGADGMYAWAGLVFDRDGNLYGTTEGGGAYGSGVVFRLRPSPDGSWTETLLHSFTGGADGSAPTGGLIFDATGNLYGTAQFGGYPSPYDNGVVFKLKPSPDGTWTESVLYTFTGGRADGGDPTAGLIFDAAGNLYGTTYSGGAYNYGVVFKLKPNPGGWSETILHTFGGYGKYPYLAPVIFDGKGNLYGTTVNGNPDYGLVFEIKP